MEEAWKDIPGYEGLYQVSNLGGIKTLTKKVRCGYNKTRTIKETELKQLKNKRGKGYMVVSLYKKGHRKTCFVHRLVLMAFVGLSNKQCNHINGITDDNRLCNLEYCTPSENMIHAHRILRIKHPFKGLIGKDNPTSKKVYQFSLEGKLIKCRDSVKDVSRELGYDNSCIGKCCKGVYKTSYNFIWRYDGNIK